MQTHKSYNKSEHEYKSKNLLYIKGEKNDMNKELRLSRHENDNPLYHNYWISGYVQKMSGHLVSVRIPYFNNKVFQFNRSHVRYVQNDICNEDKKFKLKKTDHISVKSMLEDGEYIKVTGDVMDIDLTLNNVKFEIRHKFNN